MKDFKTLTLKISPTVLDRLRSTMAIRMISGNAYGIGDEVLAKIIESVEAGNSEVILALKSEMVDQTTTRKDTDDERKDDIR